MECRTVQTLRTVKLHLERILPPVFLQICFTESFFFRITRIKLPVKYCPLFSLYAIMFYQLLHISIFSNQAVSRNLVDRGVLIKILDELGCTENNSPKPKKKFPLAKLHFSFYICF